MEDTLLGLQRLGHYVRRQSGADVVAITGSAGKTSTKEATAAFLAARYAVYRNAGNLNNHIGLPLSLLELTARPDVAVVELGMNHAGEIRRLVEWPSRTSACGPTSEMRTSDYFASADAIADAKAEVLDEAGPGDAGRRSTPTTPRVMARVQRIPGRHHHLRPRRGRRGSRDSRRGSRPRRNDAHRSRRRRLGDADRCAAFLAAARC